MILPELIEIAMFVRVSTMFYILICTDKKLYHWVIYEKAAWPTHFTKLLMVVWSIALYSAVTWLKVTWLKRTWSKRTWLKRKPLDA